MRRAILAVALLCLSVATFAQVTIPSPVVPQQFFDNTGAPCAGCFLYTYSAGTSTPLATYTDSTGTTQNTDPIVLDSAGRASIWLGAFSYKFVLQDPNSVTLWTQDNINIFLLLSRNNTWSGTQTFNGAVTFAGGINLTTFAFTNTGTFTGSQMNEPFSAITNSLNTLTEFQTAQGNTHYGTDGFTVGIAAPNTSTIYQVNGVAGYATSASTTSNVVAGYFQARNLADSAKVWGLNSWASDGSHLNTTVIGYENDVNLGSTTTIGSSILIDGIFGADMPGYGAIHIARPQAKFGYGLNIDAGATSGGAINIYQTANTGTSLSSQPLNFWGIDSGAVGRVAAITADPNGNLVLTPNAAVGTGVYIATGKAIISDIFKSSAANIANSGDIRLAHSGALAFRNNANSGDILLGMNASDYFTMPNLLVAGTVEADLGLKAGSSGTTITDSRALIQSVNDCGSTTTCANTANNSFHEVIGTVTLSTGAATLSSITGFTTIKGCTCTDQTSAAACKATPASASSVTFAGTGSDVLFYRCIGN